MENLCFFCQGQKPNPNQAKEKGQFMSSYKQTTARGSGTRAQAHASAFLWCHSLSCLWHTGILQSTEKKKNSHWQFQVTSFQVHPSRVKMLPLQFQGEELGLTNPVWDIQPMWPHPRIDCCNLNVQGWIMWVPLWPKHHGPVSGNPGRITWLR